MTTAQLILFAAVLAQVALTAVLYLRIVQARAAILKDPATRKPEMAYDQAAWPLSARLIGNSLSSQFELPVLFYAGVLFAFQFGAAGWVAAILAWIFVATRVVHMILHTGKNIVPQRFGAFLAGFIAIIVLWIYLALHVFGAGAI